MRLDNTAHEKLSFDTRSLGDLKRLAGSDPKRASSEVAKQFEVLFLNMLMKSMREAMPKDGMFNSSANDTYTGMLDQQISQKMAARGTGLAAMIERQLSGNVGNASSRPVVVAANAARAQAGAASIRFADADALNRAVNGLTEGVTSALGAINKSTSGGGKESRFLESMSAHAKHAEAVTGIPANFVLGQAALESGWGTKQILRADGSSAHNLFGIKAGADWRGQTINVTTTEYVGGIPRKAVEKFRAYSSYEDCFRDYADLISSSSRYAAVSERSASASGFADAMQRSGYATDPRYAEKLTRTINHVMSFERLARTGVSS